MAAHGRNADPQRACVRDRVQDCPPPRTRPGLFVSPPCQFRQLSADGAAATVRPCRVRRRALRHPLSSSLGETMIRMQAMWPALTVTAVLALNAAAPGAQEKPTVKIPEPGVPQVMTLEGTFVRASYNNEGYAIIGYKIANMSIGDEWMLLELGATLRDGTPLYRLNRSHLSLETPDGK